MNECRERDEKEEEKVTRDKKERRRSEREKEKEGKEKRETKLDDRTSSLSLVLWKEYVRNPRKEDLPRPAS